MATLSRERPKELAHDYLDRDLAVTTSRRAAQQTVATPSPTTVKERLRQRAEPLAQRLAVEREQERAASARALEQQRSHEQELRVSEHQKAKQRELNRDHDSGLEL